VFDRLLGDRESYIIVEASSSADYGESAGGVSLDIRYSLADERVASSSSIIDDRSSKCDARPNIGQSRVERRKSRIENNLKLGHRIAAIGY
jgi:hypothetical protein